MNEVTRIQELKNPHNTYDLRYLYHSEGYWYMASAIYMLVYFSFLAYVLKKFVTDYLKSQKRKLAVLFACLTLSYVCLSVYFFFYASEWHIVCQSFNKWITSTFVRSSCGILSILPQAIIHHFTFRTSKN